MSGLRSAAALAAAFATIVAVAAGCAGNAPDDTRPAVAVSVPAQAWIVERLAGDRVRVRIMVPPGAEAHAYEPTLDDLGALSDASLYVKVGHPKFTFEQAWLDKMLRDLPNLRVIDSSQGAAGDADDPHVWLAPSQVRTMARNVATALGELLPAQRTAVQDNLHALETEIDTVDAELRRTLGAGRGKRFFVFHPAWSYFAREYGLVQVAIERDGREPDPSTLARVIADARKTGVRVIFVQPQQSSAGARLIADEVGARIETVDPMAEDWAANLRSVGAKIAEGLVQ
jgi:zinc transport system substrate-binding protein